MFMKVLFRFLLLLVLPLTLASAQTGVPAAKASPNVIFILVDDQRYDAMGFLNASVKTPHLDRLAADGAHFQNAFVTTSLCSPSRATILTGKYMHDHRVVDNNAPVPAGTEFFPQHLQKAGYQTALIGKWHMGNTGDAPQPGFDHWVSFAGQGEYEPVDTTGKANMLNVNGQRVARRAYITDELTDYAVDWLAKRDRKKPFFLYLSHKAVHADFIPPKRYQGRYDAADISIPAEAKSSGDPGSDSPLWVKNQRNSWHGVDFAYHGDIDLVDYVRRYYSTLGAVDDSVGRIRKWLAANKLDKNTVVIYMADNGFLFGEHGLIDKRNAYEESIRVPMLMSAPGVIAPGTRVKSMSANIDIAPTILDLAGITAPKGYAGMSLLPFAKASDTPPPPPREELLYEYYWEYNYPHTPTTFAIRTPRYKLVQYHGIWDTEELFDLQADPKEQRNLIAAPELAALKLSLRRRLWEKLKDSTGNRVVPFGEKTSEGAVFRNPNGAPAGTFPKRWDREPNSVDATCHYRADTVERLEADRPNCTEGVEQGSRNQKPKSDSKTDK
jgi:N-acetylglucosamine-6-sulfatase